VRGSIITNSATTASIFVHSGSKCVKPSTPYTFVFVPEPFRTFAVTLRVLNFEGLANKLFTQFPQLFRCLRIGNVFFGRLYHVAVLEICTTLICPRVLVEYATQKTQTNAPAIDGSNAATTDVEVPSAWVFQVMCSLDGFPSAVSSPFGVSARYNPSTTKGRADRTP
jgi:hypothetical protein